jgi:hypothetical protein
VAVVIGRKSQAAVPVHCRLHNGLPAGRATDEVFAAALDSRGTPGQTICTSHGHERPANTNIRHNGHEKMALIPSGDAIILQPILKCAQADSQLFSSRFPVSVVSGE